MNDVVSLAAKTLVIMIDPFMTSFDGVTRSLDILVEIVHGRTIEVGIHQVTRVPVVMIVKGVIEATENVVVGIVTEDPTTREALDMRIMCPLSAPFIHQVLVCVVVPRHREVQVALEVTPEVEVIALDAAAAEVAAEVGVEVAAEKCTPITIFRMPIPWSNPSSFPEVGQYRNPRPSQRLHHGPNPSQRRILAGKRNSHAKTYIDRTMESLKDVVLGIIGYQEITLHKSFFYLKVMQTESGPKTSARLININVPRIRTSQIKSPTGKIVRQLTRSNGVKHTALNLT